MDRKTLRWLLSLMIVSSLLLTPVYASVSFSDIDGHWSEDYVLEMAELGLVNGDPDGTFRPDDPMNRAEAAEVLANLYVEITSIEADIGLDADGFSDVEEDAWYWGSISILQALGIADGNPDGTYEPAENINRAEYTKLVMNLYYELASLGYMPDMELTDVITDDFADLDQNEWYSGTVSYAYNLGFVSGSECDDGNCFYAGNEITRAEATTILYRVWDISIEVDTQEENVELSKYVDGEYFAEGPYKDPAGDEDMGVTLTIENDLVTAVDIDENAQNSTSSIYQNLFIDGIEVLVVGVALDDIEEFDNVNGASLTPKGFQDAVESIRVEALRE